MLTNSNRKEISGILFLALFNKVTMEEYEISHEEIIMAIADFEGMAVRWLGTPTQSSKIEPPRTEIVPQTIDETVAEKKERKPRTKRDSKQSEEPQSTYQVEVPTEEVEKSETVSVESSKEDVTNPEEYDPLNKKHKTELAAILKSQHSFNLNDPTYSKAAGIINSALSGQLIDETFSEAVSKLVSKTPLF